MTAEQTRLAAKTIVLTTVAMVAFAANSLLCRLALGGEAIDAGWFTAIRVAAGAATLALVLAWQRKQHTERNRPDWRAGAMLFTYMVFFSFAYLSLSAGTGALILFGAVQLTMFLTALRQGEAFTPLSWTGLALAVAGLIYLVSPGLTAPDLLGAVLMAIAGIAWGVYSLLGRGAADPLQATAYAFFYAVPPALLVGFAAGIFSASVVTPQGIALAVASGALASGCGYVVWYAALRGLTAGRAAVVQLSVPVIAALGGVVFLAEDVTVRLVVASAATLGGVLLVLAQRAR